MGFGGEARAVALVHQAAPMPSSSHNLSMVRPMSEKGVRRAKAALSSGCKSHPATAPARSNRSSHGGNEVAEAFD